MDLDPRLLEILACPSDDHAPLEQRGATLVCTSCGRVFPIVDGIPVLLLDEALPPADGVPSGTGG
jgi:hypothetical protein